MKALSIRQPWATLIAIKALGFITRHRSTEHRGPLVIHAAKDRDQVIDAICAKEPFAGILARAGIGGVGALPFGSLICVTDLRQVYQVAADGMYSPGRLSIRGFPSAAELALGDFTIGFFALELVDVRRLPAPIDHADAGEAGFFDVPDALVAEVASV